jgi:hypothetical protein
MTGMGRIPAGSRITAYVVGAAIAVIGDACGVFQGSCRVNRFHHAAFWYSISGRSGLSVTAPIGDQFRVFLTIIRGVRPWLTASRLYSGE